MQRLGLLAFLALAISVCVVRLVPGGPSMPRMAASDVVLTSAANSDFSLVTSAPESRPECCEVQPVLLSATPSIAVLLMLALVVIQTARVLPPISQSRAAANHFQPPGLRGRAALFASLT
jgi:hypothetical protein